MCSHSYFHQPRVFHVILIFSTVCGDQGKKRMANRSWFEFRQILGPESYEHLETLSSLVDVKRLGFDFPLSPVLDTASEPN